MNVALLRVLLEHKEAIAQRRGNLRLANLAPRIYSVFAVTQLNRAIEICDSLEGAKALSAQPRQ